MTLVGTTKAGLTLARGTFVPVALRSAGRSACSIPALGVAMLGLEAAGLAAQASDALHLNVALTLGQSALYAAAVVLVVRGAPASSGVILAVSVLLRLTLLFAPPFHSTDIYRYVWDGRVQAAGINPYLHVPGDPALSALRDDLVWPRINRADYAPTIYPPLAQVVFLLVTRVSATVTAMKLALVLFEGVTAWAIVRLLDADGLPRTRLLVYAWSPLAIWEVAGAGHVDAAMAAFVALAVLASRRGREGLAGVALGAAVLVKLLPLAILPALWRRPDRRMPACFAATVVAGYLPFLGAGRKVFGFLPGYAGEEGLRDGSGFWFARLIGRLTGLAPSPAAFVAGTACLMGLLALVVVTRRNRSAHAPENALLLAGTGMVALSPSYPWYFVWLLPLLCVSPKPALVWITSAGALLYWDDIATAPWLKDALYGGACLAAAGSAVVAIIRHRWERQA